MRLKLKLREYSLFVLVIFTIGLLAGISLVPGCGGGSSPNGAKCSQCGDTDGPCDNPDLSKKVCWNTDEPCPDTCGVDQACTGEGACDSNPCVEFRECSLSGAVCSNDDDCGTDGGSCGLRKRCLGGFDKTCSSDADCPECVSERLACLRKLGSAERICFDLNLRNVPALQCGDKFTLAGTTTTVTPTPAPATPTPTPTGTTTTTSSSSTTTGP